MKKFKLSDDFLNKFEIFLLVLIVSIISFYVVLSKLILKYNTIISIIIGIISLISAILTIIIENTKDKRKKLKQEKTINDYKPNDYVPQTMLILFVFLYLSFIIISFSKMYNINIDKNNLCSINIGLYSLIFVVYTFILPTYKKEIKKLEYRIDKKIKRTKSKRDLKIVSFYQSEIYYLKIKFNKLTMNIIINSFLFILAIIASIDIFESISFISISCIMFCLYNVINIMFEVKRLYNFDLKNYEKKSKKQLEYIKNKSNFDNFSDN